MIKNDRQYRVTRAQARRFAEALTHIEDSAAPPDLHPRLRQAQVEAVRGQLQELEAQLAAYDALRSGQRPEVEWESFAELPQILIRARIASGLSQRDLAERLGLKEQQVQRYEATDYGGASLTRLMDFAKTLGLELPRAASVSAAGFSLPSLLNRLKACGLETPFVRRRLIGAVPTDTPPELVSVRLASNVSRVFGWDAANLLGPVPPQVDPSVVAAARFKVPAGVNEPRLAAYTVYAHYLALLVLRACEKPAAAVPSDPSALRSEIIDRYGSLSLESALRYTWQAGIPVLPLADPGAFHGAMWRVHGRNVIVLKQTTTSLLRWLFDLLHEVKHVLSAPNELDLSIIELDPLADERKHSDEEESASQFAGDVLLDGRAEELVKLCVKLAKGEVRQLKAAVRTIAKEQAVSQDALANYLAYRLSLQDINWWGAAANLQTQVGDPWRVARDLLLQHVDFKPLGDVDRELLRLALSDQPGGSDA